MSIYSGQAAVAFDRVKEEADWEGWRNILLRRPNNLLSFTAVRKTLNLSCAHIYEFKTQVTLNSHDDLNSFHLN